MLVRLNLYMVDGSLSTPKDSIAPGFSPNWGTPLPI